MKWILSTIIVFGLLAEMTFSSTLPLHKPLRLLIISDEVNPHGLPDNELTQPGDLSSALVNVSSGLNISELAGSVHEIATNNIDQAIALLTLPFDDPNAYDCLIYFAHRIPNDDTPAQNNADQAAFVSAVENFLVAGGGIVSFHHGSYLTNGKESIQDIIGVTATGSVPWNIIEGQNVINVSPEHFITTNGIEYTGNVIYSDVPRNIPLADYSFFNNTPDERYINFEINPTAQNIEILFGSNYNQNGTSHILGFTHQAPNWQGVVVGYQPGEYQPHALDDPNNNNFQILANAIVYAPSSMFLGDLNSDRTVDSEDIDLLLAAIQMNNQDMTFDINNDTLVNQSDFTFLIETILQTSLGDTNLDGVTDIIDLEHLTESWLQNGNWANGDLNGDNMIDLYDFTILTLGWQ